MSPVLGRLSSSQGFGFGQRRIEEVSYTTRGLIFDYDPQYLSFTNGQLLSSVTDLSSGIISTNTMSGTTVSIDAGSVNYNTANGGNLDSSSNTGRITATGVNLQGALDACASITLSCWFQSPSNARMVLMSRFAAGGWLNQFNHLIDPGQELHYNFSGVIAGANGDINTQVFTANEWTLSHCVYNVSDGIVRWYMDGSQVATVNIGTDGGNGLTGTAPTSGQGFTWMARSDDGERLIGLMGPVRIHNVGLTPDECLNDFDVEKSRYGK